MGPFFFWWCLFSCGAFFFLVEPFFQTCTIEGHGASNTTKIPREDSQEREERMKIVAGRKKKRAKFWPTLRPSTPEKNGKTKEGKTKEDKHMKKKHKRKKHKRKQKKRKQKKRKNKRGKNKRGKNRGKNRRKNKRGKKRKKEKNKQKKTNRIKK